MIKELKICQSITPRDSQSLVRYFNDINPTKPLTPDEEVELAVRIQRGDVEARNKLVEANLRFVISVAKQYQNSGIALNDLINEGNIGLIRAAERYDPTRGFKFDTFAVWWIRQSITTALAEVSRTVRLPLNVVGQLSRIRKAENQFEQTHQRPPSADELSEILGMSKERITELMGKSSRATSLDAPLSDDSDTTVVDMMENDSTPPADAKLISESMSYDLGQALDTLPPREKQILCLIFGLETGEEVPIDVVAMNMNITRERVRQLRELAIRRLYTKYAHKLSQYVV